MSLCGGTVRKQKGGQPRRCNTQQRHINCHSTHLPITAALKYGHTLHKSIRRKDSVKRIKRWRVCYVINHAEQHVTTAAAITTAAI